MITHRYDEVTGKCCECGTNIINQHSRHLTCEQMKTLQQLDGAKKPANNEELTFESFIQYLRRDMVWLEGFAAALDSGALNAKVNSIQKNINLIEKTYEVSNA